MIKRPFYFSTVRNLTAAFGTLFSDIYIQRVKADGALDSCIKVPLAYAAADKTIVMLQQRNPTIASNPPGVDLKMVLPRMGFELTGINYDSERKTQTLIKNVYPPLSPITFNAYTAVNPTTDTFTVPNHGIVSGRALVYDANGATGIGGLVDGQRYYGIKVDNNTFKVQGIWDTIIQVSSCVSICSCSL
jgi:T4-like virus Myoviridae tail sheath stabiliser